MSPRRSFVVALAALAPIAFLSAGPSLTSFTNGQAADAEQVNANFGILEDRLNAATVQVPVVTGWAAFVPELVVDPANPGNTPYQLATAPDANKAFWRRVGENMEVMWSYKHFAIGGPPGASQGTGLFLVRVPGGETVDVSKLENRSSAMGWGTYNVSSTTGGTWTGAAGILDPDTIWGTAMVNASNGGTNLTHGVLKMGDDSVRISFHITVPIVGWSATEGLGLTIP